MVLVVAFVVVSIVVAVIVVVAVAEVLRRKESRLVSRSHSSISGISGTVVAGSRSHSCESSKSGK